MFYNPDFSAPFLYLNFPFLSLSSAQLKELSPASLSPSSPSSSRLPWWLPSDYHPVHHWLVPFSLGVENDCCFGSMNLHCLPYLAEQRLPEGPCNLELEIPPVPLPLRVVFRQMLGDGVLQVSPLDAVGVLLCTDVSAVPTLAGIYSCEFL